MFDFRIASIIAAASLIPAIGFIQTKPKSGSPPKKQSAVEDLLPQFEKLCGKCHTGPQAPGGFNLLKFRNVSNMAKDPTTWERVARALGSGQMPPSGASQPSEAKRKAMVSWVESTLTANCDLTDPGRVTIRRLNREEYNNTVRDLFGISLRPADDFPSDDVGYGFDNIGDVLSISPLLMEK